MPSIGSTGPLIFTKMKTCGRETIDTQASMLEVAKAERRPGRAASALQEALAVLRAWGTFDYLLSR